jgi:hypothetical protein
MAGPSEASPPGDVDGLRQRSDRIERLLDEVRAMASPAAWQRVEQLVQTLVELYGLGLERLLALVGDGGPLDDALADRLAGDDLCAGLLALHGLHPLDATTRIRRALVEAAPDVPGLELIALEEGLARLRVAGSGVARSPSRAEQLARSLTRLVEEVAPEVTRVVIEGLERPEAAPQAQPLVQIDLARSRGRRGI